MKSSHSSISDSPKAHQPYEAPRISVLYLSRWRRTVKRIMDIVIALVMLILLLPLMTLIALAIKVDSRGPVFFAHARVGKFGRRIKVLKFRTMVRDSEALLRDLLEADPGARDEWERTQKLRKDPRVTRVGRRLRRFSLDELPQLLNIVRGDMSLIGPRPVIEEEIERFRALAGLMMAVKPGATGLWQISGRNDVTYEERVQLECRYAREWSLLLDFKILIRTVPSILRSRGAY